MAKAVIKNLWDTMVYNDSNWFVVQMALQSHYFSEENCFIAEAVTQNLCNTNVTYDSN